MKSGRGKGERQLALIAQSLGAGRSVAVDNTNPTVEDRAPLIAAARAHGARPVAYHLATPARECAARNRAREGRARVPDAAIYIIAKRLRAPSKDEGFDAVITVTAQDGGYVTAPPA
jgi:predicted kinase